MFAFLSSVESLVIRFFPDVVGAFSPAVSGSLVNAVLAHCSAE
jgi:hypothetical protein